MKKLTSSGVLLILIMFCTSCIREDNTPVKIAPISGAILSPEIGGPSEKNQIWIELSSGTVSATHREDWDLGFYSGPEFRVILNSSLIMAVGKIENTFDIDSVNAASVADLKNKVQVANFADNSIYIDDPSGNLLNQTTGIAEIKTRDNENNVYLLNLGYSTYEGDMVPGSVYTVGEARGWK